MHKIPIIETERLILRSFHNSDLQRYAQICAKPEFMRFMGEGEPLTREQAWHNIAYTLGHWELRDHGVWALEEKESHQLIGRVGIINPEGWPGPEVCWALDPDYWGKGYATEAAREVIHWGFCHLSLPRIISVIAPNNIRSAKVAERLGEEFSHQQRINDKIVDIYAIERPQQL
ncbi:GNAT family N-acetyltransferase [Dongshaea marina]|uniref:GNAT family N-acetyltransferase n=1 Tax=Dongshaea marina TaxID=2047966 RepID=UPI000D3E2117|nr:GNAT family N-acetyltransferase [Dongshaea marina]